MSIAGHFQKQRKQFYHYDMKTGHQLKCLLFAACVRLIYLLHKTRVDGGSLFSGITANHRATGREKHNW